MSLAISEKETIDVFTDFAGLLIISQFDNFTGVLLMMIFHPAEEEVEEGEHMKKIEPFTSF